MAVFAVTATVTDMVTGESKTMAAPFVVNVPAESEPPVEDR